MDKERFDRITRRLASGQSRRGVRKGLVGSALGGTLAAMGLASGAAKPAGKVAVCHFDATTGLYDHITVAYRAVPAHRAHGDGINPNFQTDVKNCGACGVTCRPGELCVGGICASPVGVNPILTRP